MIKQTILVGALAVAMFGCATATSEEQVTKGENAIINGEETSDYPGVVALYGKKPGEDKGALCTAEVVSPTVILTAAHCVAPAVVGEGLVFNVLVGANLTDAAHPATKLPVKEVHWNEKFDAQQLQNGNDIAVAILAEPTTIKPIKINRGSISTSDVTSARLVGYGLNDGFNQTGAGIKRTAEVPVSSIDDKFVVTGSWGGTTMCNGDSGGPVLADIGGELTIIGVNSFGFIYCLGTGSSTRVDSYLDFVDTYVH
jgi:secreted trypsin-like serine protease